MKTKAWIKKESLRLVVILLPFAFLVIFWPDLPNRIPMHWNLTGEIDGYGSKLGLLGLAGINLVLWGIFLLMPQMEPKRQNYPLAQDKWQIVQVVIHLFFTYIFLLIGFISLGYSLQVDLAIKYGVIGLFLILGSYLGTVKPNTFIGVRTPWTLRSDHVWRKTHRFTATLWVMGSLFMFIYSSFWEKTYPWAFFVYIGMLAVAPIIYSYVIFKTQPEVPSSPKGE